VIEHPWDLTPKQAVALQREPADQIRIEPLAEARDARPVTFPYVSGLLSFRGSSTQ
jgi:deoxyinosine 3'endonuclease (endonuclease V)